VHLVGFHYKNSIDVFYDAKLGISHSRSEPVPYVDVVWESGAGKNI
jgi:hypothetical protein